MDEPYEYTDRDGDRLTVEPIARDGVPLAALGIEDATGRIVAAHIPAEDAWEVCEAILEAAGVNAGA